ncbi:exosome catalytic subunit dis3 [Tulasnella sp. 418]|nr:exosome catalytic subunit dis3 [Tulasnella sp. 418]
MDLLESPSFKPPIILLQTVLEEVRHRSIPLHSRLKALLKHEDKCIWLFYNEFNADTAFFRQESESPNDRNDRGIRLAAEWYNTHVINTFPGSKMTNKPIVLLLTNDRLNKAKAQSSKIPSSSVREYLMGMKEPNSLLDILTLSSDDTEEDQSRPPVKNALIYPSYLPTTACLAGVKSGHLHQGHFNASPYNYLEGIVTVPAFKKPILLIGRENMNRSVQGDVVVVEVFPESEWKSPTEEVVDQDNESKNDDPEQPDDGGNIDSTSDSKHYTKTSTSIRSLQPSSDRQPTGKVVGVIRRSWRAYVCHIDRTSLSSTASSLSTQTVFASPLSRSIPRIRLRTRQAPQLMGQKILVTIDRWDETSKYPEGHFVRALGGVGEEDAERESLLLEYEVPFRPFGRAVRDCLPAEGENWVVPSKDNDPRGVWKGRDDLRELIVCSIDPPNCQDIDDALHARKLPNGNIEAGVHIADVSHFVAANTAMDVEAASRGTTVYLVDKRIDMLPSLLGTNLCSLRPNVERLAFSAIWEMTAEAEVINVRFTKSVITSKAAFTYEEAQIRKDDPRRTDTLTESIRLLNSLARQLKAARMAAGALNLASPEVKIHLQSAESSDPIDVEQKELRETNSLVEEFMLLANISVARKIQETFPQSAVLRRHLPPPKTNFEKLQDVLLKRRNIVLDVSSSGALASSLDKCVDSKEPAFNTLVRIMATRCMLSAEYFCSGSVARDTFGHYGLASPIYTHFTSPIRRYADILAHRQLAATINFAPLHATLHSKGHIEAVLDNINRRHRMAQMASRASVEFYVGLALKDREKKNGGLLPQEDAFVIRTLKNGISVFVSALGLEGLIMFDGETVFDPEAYSITTNLNGKQVTIAVFDRVRVEISVTKDLSTQRDKVKMVIVGV